MIVRVYNVSDPDQPTYQGEILGFSADRVNMHPDSEHLLLDMSSFGVMSLFTDPTTFTNVYVKPLLGPDYLISHQDRLYTGSYGVIGLINLTNQLDLTIQSQLQSVLIHPFYIPHGNYIYSRGYFEEFINVIDFSDPDAPRLDHHWYELDEEGNRIYPRDATICGDNLAIIFYLSNQTSEIILYNCQGNSRSPQRISRLTLDLPAYQVSSDIESNLLFVSHLDSGKISIVDISNPIHPQLRSRISGLRRSYGGRYNMAVVDHFLYVGEYHNEQGLKIYNVENPDNPELVTVIDSLNHIQYFQKHENWIFANRARIVNNAWTGRLSIWDIRNPLEPKEVGYFGSDGNPSGFYLDSPYLYVAEGNQLGIYDVSRALSVRDEIPVVLQPLAFFLSAYPNPFNSTVTITFSTGRDARPTRLGVYDVSGRLVADFDGRSKGENRTEHSISWNAEGLPGGIYLIRLESGSETRTVKAVLMK